MNIRVENVLTPINNIVSRSAKWVVVDIGDYPIYLLIATGFKKINLNNGGESWSISTPDRSIFKAHLVITTDIMARNFSIPKNRFGHNLSDRPSRVFLNHDLDITLNDFGIQNRFNRAKLKSSIISVITEITDEPIYFIDGEWKTYRDMHLDKTVFIKYKQYIHKIV